MILSEILATTSNSWDTKIIERFNKEEIYICFSIDGLKKHHDKYRVFSSGKGSHELVMKNLTNCIKIIPKKRLRARITVQPTESKYLKENIAKDSFKLIDPGNSNNDVVSSMESWDKDNLSNKLGLIIDRIEDNSENIKTYFPLNEDFKDDDDKSSNSKYGLKDGIIPSIPLTNQRFG